MSPSITTARKGRLNGTYTGYSVGCAVVWAVILLVAQHRLDAQNRNMLRLVCGGWWSGWTSATIARAGYPPPKRLRPEAEKRLGIASIVLVAVGLISVVRLLITGKRPSSWATPLPRRCR
jgi:hypothetical protein